MKKKITVTLTTTIDFDDEYLKRYDVRYLDDVRDANYYNVNKPLTEMEDAGWKIIKKNIEDIEYYE